MLVQFGQRDITPSVVTLVDKISVIYLQSNKKSKLLVEII